MGERGRSREGHQDVTRPTGPRGRLAGRSEVRQGPSPTTGARGGDRGLAGGSKGKREDRAKQARQKPTLEAGGEPRKVQLSGAAERRRGEQLQRLRIAGLEVGLAGKGAEPCRQPPLPDSCSSGAQRKGAELPRPVEPDSELSGGRTVTRAPWRWPLADRS